MTSLRKIVTNTVILFIGQMVTWASTLLLTIAYGRFLGDFKFGEIYFALTFVSLLGIPLQSGYNSQTKRDVAQYPDKAQHYFSNILIIKLTIWPIVYLLALLISWLLGYTTEVRILVAICGFILLTGAIADTFASLHYAFERTLYPAAGNIFEKGLSALIGFFILKLGAGVEAMVIVMLGGSLVNAIWQAIWFFRLVGTRFVFDLSLIRALVRGNVPFLIYAALALSYYRIDTVILSLMTNSAVVGWYGAGTRLFDTLGFLPNLVENIVYPVSSKASLSSDDTNLKLTIEKAVNLLLFCGIPTATVMIVAAPNIIGFLYHREEFAHTIPVLQALAPGLIFLYMNTALGILMLSKKQEKKIPFMAATALVFNVGLNLIFIRLFQHVGAALVTSLTEMLLFCLALAFIPRHLLPFRSLKVGIKATIASCIMALIVLLLHTLSILVILPVAMVVYFGAAALLRTLPGKDVQAVYRAIRNKAEKGPPTPEEGQITPVLPGNDLDITDKYPAIRLKLIQQPCDDIPPENIDREVTEKHSAIRPQPGRRQPIPKTNIPVSEELTHQ